MIQKYSAQGNQRYQWTRLEDRSASRCLGDPIVYAWHGREPFGPETCRRALRLWDMSTSSSRVAQGRTAHVESLKAEGLMGCKSPVRLSCSYGMLSCV